MRLRTRLTERFDIEHPIISAPMGMVAGGRLAAAVSNAGGLGLIGGGYGDGGWLEREFSAAGNAKVGCGFITWSLAHRPELLDQVLARKPAAVMLSFGPVTAFAAQIRHSGVPVICQVQSMAHAREAVGAGAEVIVAQGGEAGGHSGNRSTFTLVSEVADYLAKTAPDTLLVAAGGVADGRSLAAALMLGADGVLVGTRFYATQEAMGPGAAKERIVAASGDKTIRSILFDIARRNVWPAPFTGRVLRNEFSERWRGREAELMQHQAEEAARYDKARQEGDFDTAAVIAGEGVDMISDIPPAKDVVDRMVKEASALLAGSNRYRVSA